MNTASKSGAQTDAFDKRYKELNAAQKRAVDAIEGPVMVVAGPGTGKTTILTLRIANILRQTDTPPSGILAITYTDAGVKAMRAKLQSIIGSRAHEVRIHTFHSFAASIIAEHPDQFLVLDGLTQMTTIDQETLVRGILEAPEFASLRPIGKPDAYLFSLLRLIDDAKREAMSPDKVRAHAQNEIERIKNDEASISTRGATKGQLKADARERIERCEKTILAAGVYERYEIAKAEKKLMDFNDLIIELLAALRSDELLLRLVQEQFLYIHVDEHQDTNDAQNMIVSLIAEFFETPNIFIVGDEKQAIYRFQGASVDNFFLLRKKWPGMQRITLDMNYRSHQTILDAGFSLIEHNYEGDEHQDLRVRLTAGGAGEARPIEVVTGENVAAVEAELVSRLKALTANAEKQGAAMPTVAIITRKNRELERVIRVLEAAGMPVSSERSVDIFAHPIGSLFFDLLEFLADPTRTDALARTLAAGMWGLPFERAAELIRAVRSGLATSDIEGMLPALRKIRSLLLDDAALGFIVQAADLSGFSGLVARDPTYAQVWHGIVSLAESLARGGDIRRPLGLAEALLAYRLSAESKTVKVSVGAPDLPIQAMTAHGSKGLEYDYVFIPYATEEAWVGRPRGSSFVLPEKRASDNAINDIRRLFYVAMTRAREHVVIMSALEESDGKALSPVRFVAEIDPAYLAHSRVERVQAGMAFSASSGAASTGSTGRQRAILDFAKRNLLESGLSVTALNHFLKCPNEYIYASVLKLPQAPAPAAEKGTAMHAAISEIWKSGARGAAAIQEVAEKAVAAYMATSLLSVREKEAVIRDLSENMPAFAAAMAPHFASASIDLAAPGPHALTEHWVRASFESPTATIPIHGKLDAIVESGQSVSVFDYKTRQAMSVAKIKGDTADSDGGYFRQLVFYRLLLESDPKWKGKDIAPALVFVSPDEKGRCPTVALPIETADVEAVRADIRSLIDAVWSGSLVGKKCEDEECEWCRLEEASR